MSEKRGLQIAEMAGDGNCLFHAIAHQIYGDPSLHKVIREKCMQYIYVGKDYFKSFVPDEPIEEYCARKSHLGVWGDDVEL